MRGNGVGGGGGGEDIYKKEKKDRFRFITPAESETRTSFFSLRATRKKKILETEKRRRVLPEEDDAAIPLWWFYWTGKNWRICPGCAAAGRTVHHHHDCLGERIGEDNSCDFGFSPDFRRRWMLNNNPWRKSRK